MDESLRWFNEGVALYENGDYRRAITAFDKAIAIDPTLPEVWNNRGLALIQTDQYEEALRSIDEALSLSPGYKNAKKARKTVLGLIKDSENANTAPGQAGSSLPPARKRSKILAAVVIVIVVIAVAAGGFVVIKKMQNPAGLPVPATPTPGPVSSPSTIPATAPTTPLITAATSAAVPAPAHPVVPSSGVWMEIIYDRFYSGSIGVPGNQQTISGTQQNMPDTGDHFFHIPANDGLVTASLAKNDGSDDELTVNIYKDGTLFRTGSTTLPYGNLDVTADIPASVATSVAGNSTENVTAPAESGA